MSPRAAPTAEVLSRRALNRALLARQHLIERVDMPVADMVEHLVGMQAQDPRHPYIALWDRLPGFDPDALAGLILNRDIVRLSLMRGTVHLVTARDALALRPVMQPVVERMLRSGAWAPGMVGIDRDALTAAGREIVEEKPRTTAQLAALLAERFPEHDGRSMAYAMHVLAPMVHVPPRGIWGRSGQTTLTTAEAWLGASLGPAMPLPDLVLRYLGAFGPAGVNDIQAWCGLTRLREVVEGMRAVLLTFRDEHGKELFDLPDAPRPHEGTPAPARFLPEYDNVILGHADRSRMGTEEARDRFMRASGLWSTFLVDGFVSGIWKHTREARTSVLTIEPFRRLAPTGADWRRRSRERCWRKVRNCSISSRPRATRVT